MLSLKGGLFYLIIPFFPMQILNRVQNDCAHGHSELDSESARWQIKNYLNKIPYKSGEES